MDSLRRLYDHSCGPQPKEEKKKTNYKKLINFEISRIDNQMVLNKIKDKLVGNLNIEIDGHF